MVGGGKQSVKLMSVPPVQWSTIGLASVRLPNQPRRDHDGRPPVLLLTNKQLC